MTGWRTAAIVGITDRPVAGELPEVTQWDPTPEEQGALRDRLLDEQLERAVREQGEGDLEELLHAGDTWTIE